MDGPPARPGRTQTNTDRHGHLSFVRGRRAGGGPPATPVLACAPTGDLMEDVVILSAARTPIGAFQGALAGFSAHALGARAIGSAIERAGLQPAEVQQVNMGCVLSA